MGNQWSAGIVSAARESFRSHSVTDRSQWRPIFESSGEFWNG